jgi:hypothetical protein
MMIEVFKTNVTDRDKANWLIVQIQNRFDTYSASFDLEDCDLILVVKCTVGNVQSSLVIDLLRSFGYEGDVLPD